MKRVFYLLIILVVISGLLFANQEIKTESSKKIIPKSQALSAAEKNAALKKWEASPDGRQFKKWEASTTGKKVHASSAKISKNIKNFTNMEAFITSLSLPPYSRLGFGVMVNINGDDYILAFGTENSENNSDFRQLHNLKVNDKISIRSHTVSKAPKYAYPIIAGDYIEKNHKIIYKRAPRKGGC